MSHDQDTATRYADIPCVFPCRPFAEPSDYQRMRRARAEYRASARRSRGYTQTALDVAGPATPNVVTIERGEKYSAWVRPSSVITYLDKLEIPRQWYLIFGAWGFPKARLSDLIAALEADGRGVVLIDVHGR